MRTFALDRERLRCSAARYWERGIGAGRAVLEFCNENVILFAVGLLVVLVAAILVAWFQWQTRHAEFGLFISQGL